MSYLWHVMVLIEIYLLLSLSLNLVVGYGGMLSLCHASFYGVGAYTGALLMTGAGPLPEVHEFCVILPAAAASTVLFSLLVSGPFFKLKGDYLALASVGLQTVFFVAVYNLTGLTQGAFGIADIPEMTVLGRRVSDLRFAPFIDHTLSFLLFCSAVTGACIWLLYRVSSSPFGRALKAVREDELAAVSLGKDVSRLKVVAFATAAGFAGVAGVLFMGYSHFIDPTSFTLMESVFILSILIVGGAGNFSGPFVGTLLMILMPEALRFLQIPDSVAPNVRQIIDGCLIIAMMRFRPRGLVGEYRFG